MLVRSQSDSLFSHLTGSRQAPILAGFEPRPDETRAWELGAGLPDQQDQRKVDVINIVLHLFDCQVTKSVEAESDPYRLNWALIFMHVQSSIVGLQR